MALARKKDTPCASCGDLIWRPTKDQPPPGVAMCRPCRGNVYRADIDHGSRIMYRERGCRCDECRKWNAAQMRAYVESVREREGLSPSQKYRPAKVSRRPPGECCKCGKALAQAASSEAMCTPCRMRSKRAIPIGAADRLAIYERDHWTCGFCSEAVDADAKHPSPWAPSLDHIIPRSKGGPDEESNLRLVHRYCNGVRSNKDALTLEELTA